MVGENSLWIVTLMQEATMIAEADAQKIFKINIGRTNKLLDVIDKVKGYNWLAQQRYADRERDLLETVVRVQNEDLEAIERTCAEHAIVSLGTVFETYSGELLQELLFAKPEYFTNRVCQHTMIISNLLSATQSYTSEEIEKQLRIKKRTDYYEFFQEFGIPFVTVEADRETINYIYAWRNHFVHNANRPDSRLDGELSRIKAPVKEINLVTRAKRLRTKLTRLISKTDTQVREVVYK